MHTLHCDCERKVEQKNGEGVDHKSPILPSSDTPEPQHHTGYNIPSPQQCYTLYCNNVTHYTATMLHIILQQCYILDRVYQNRGILYPHSARHTNIYVTKTHCHPKTHGRNCVSHQPALYLATLSSNIYVCCMIV